MSFMPLDIIQARLTTPEVRTPSIHPNLAILYREKVSSLHDELKTVTSDNTATLNALRNLIERVELGPGSGKKNSDPEIILTGALAAMVQLGTGQTYTITGPSPYGASPVPDLFSSSKIWLRG